MSQLVPRKNINKLAKLRQLKYWLVLSRELLESTKDKQSPENKEKALKFIEKTYSLKKCFFQETCKNYHNVCYDTFRVIMVHYYKGKFFLPIIPKSLEKIKEFPDINFSQSKYSNQKNFTKNYFYLIKFNDNTTIKYGITGTIIKRMKEHNTKFKGIKECLFWDSEYACSLEKEINSKTKSEWLHISAFKKAENIISGILGKPTPINLKLITK